MGLRRPVRTRALCGDVSLPFGLCDGDSIAFLAGHISGGLFVVTDIRDAIANIFSGDLVGAGLSIFSAVPFAGDAASVPIKVVEVHRACRPDG